MRARRQLCATRGEARGGCSGADARLGLALLAHPRAAGLLFLRGGSRHGLCLWPEHRHLTRREPSAVLDLFRRLGRERRRRRGERGVARGAELHPGPAQGVLGAERPVGAGDVHEGDRERLRPPRLHGRGAQPGAQLPRSAQAHRARRADQQRNSMWVQSDRV